MIDLAIRPAFVPASAEQIDSALLRFDETELPRHDQVEAAPTGAVEPLRTEAFAVNVDPRESAPGRLFLVEDTGLCVVDAKQLDLRRPWQRKGLSQGPEAVFARDRV